MKTNNKKLAFMGRGTTPKIRFDFQQDENNKAKSIVVHFKGTESKNVIHKIVPVDETNENYTLDKGYLEVNLEAHETKMFEHREKIMMSIKATLTDNTILYCPPIYTYMGEVIDEDDCPACT